MSRWKRPGGSTLAGMLLGGLAVALVGGIGAASAAPHPGSQPANPHVTVRPHAAVDSAVESRFTPITPCRIVDTRLAGGRLSSSVPRSFLATGTTGFVPQGGKSGGCGVPAAATAVQANVTAVSPAGYGILRVYPYGTSEPTATLLTYTATNAGIGTGASLTINGTGARSLTAITHGGLTHVVIDVTGYYVKPMWAEVSSSATLVRGSRVTGVARVGTGAYQVDFDRDVTNCAYTATDYFTGYIAIVEPRSGDAHGVYVNSVSPGGALTDSYFYLTVTC